MLNYAFKDKSRDIKCEITKWKKEAIELGIILVL